MSNSNNKKKSNGIPIKQDSEPIDNETEDTNNKLPLDPIKILESLTKNNQTSHMDMERFSKAFEDGIKALTETNPESLPKLTELEKKKIEALAVVMALVRRYKLRSLGAWLDGYFLLQVSNERKGRSELVIILQILNQLHQFDLMANSPMASMFPMMGMGMPFMGGNNNNLGFSGSAMNNYMNNPETGVRRSRWRFWRH